MECFVDNMSGTATAAEPLRCVFRVRDNSRGARSVAVAALLSHRCTASSEFSPRPRRRIVNRPLSLLLSYAGRISPGLPPSAATTAVSLVDTTPISYRRGNIITVRYSSPAAPYIVSSAKKTHALSAIHTRRDFDDLYHSTVISNTRYKCHTVRVRDPYDT